MLDEFIQVYVRWVYPWSMLDEFILVYVR